MQGQNEPSCSQATISNMAAQSEAFNYFSNAWNI